MTTAATNAVKLTIDEGVETDEPTTGMVSPDFEHQLARAVQQISQVTAMMVPGQVVIIERHDLLDTTAPALFSLRWTQPEGTE